MASQAIVSFLTADHRHCDEQLATFEALVQQRNWPAAAAAWRSFELATRCHFDREEQVLFPAFERATGHAGGPTMVMRMEHEQMRALLGPLATAVAAHDEHRCLDLSESLMLLIQQHNMKEEQVLYPMCDQVLGEPAAMCRQLEALRPDRG
ncbi:MAG: hemerythrin domain-containing protein [Planctomycetes bacterium]|nr:hemerythrin domain-containing protein [Planctomycetota bacterium]MCC7396679.1 hemerythrin domain-containing protein [Planctomycetota bacterium]